MSMRNVLNVEEFHQLSEQAQYEGGLMINLSDDKFVEYGKIAIFDKAGLYFVVKNEDIRIHSKKTFKQVGNHQLNPNEYAINNAIPVSRIHKVIDDIIKNDNPSELSPDELDKTIQDILDHVGITDLNKMEEVNNE